MKVNDLAEFLEYSPSRAPVCVAMIDPDGNVVRHESPAFLLRDGEVLLIVDQRAHVGTPATPDEDLVVSDLERPQVFGDRMVMVSKPDQAAARFLANLS